MSSGEAEFYGAVKGAAAGLGMKALYRDIGYQLPLRLWTDSSAAVGICSRQGLGKLRHLECTSLWIQQRIRLCELEVRKIAGEVNPADLYTKHLETKAKIEQLVQLFGAEFRDGRPAAAPQLRKDPVVAAMVDEPHGPTSLPHLMSRGDIDRLYEVAKIDEGNNKEWADLVTPAVELADPGSDGRLEFTPAISKHGALTVYDEEDDGPRRMARPKAWSTTPTSHNNDTRPITDESYDDMTHLVLPTTLPITLQSQ